MMKHKNAPNSVWCNIVEGANQSPDWDREYKKLLDEEKTSNEIGWLYQPIPFLNPFNLTKQEVYLELSSYISLLNVVVLRGGEIVTFDFKK